MAELNKTQLQSENQSSFPTNNSRLITAEALRNFNTDMIDSLVDEVSYNINSASLSSSVAGLNNAIDVLQLQSGSTVLVAEEGTLLGVAARLNFEGNNITTTLDSDIATITTNSFPFTGSAKITGSLTITGSVNGNVISISEISNTSSIDLSEGNFFVGGVNANSYFNVINPKVGQTAMLKLTTTGVATASFSPNVLQPPTPYIPTPGNNNVDILTFVSFDGTYVYLVVSKDFA
jgi:hypothetical protein